MGSKPKVPVIAYSYIRFSHPDQAKGDSLRRQTELAAAYCARRGWTLSESTYKDLGVSAFKGANALIGNLGEFLKAVKAGAIAPGSALICESIDRISRQGIDEGYDFIKGILKAGVLLVTLSPEREFDISATKSLSKGALEIQLILERAAEESERKADRVGAAWRKKKERAANGEPLTQRVPGWLRVQGGRFVVVEKNADAVRRIYRMAIDGHGMAIITKRLNVEGVPTIGRARYWARSYVAKLLVTRAVVGEYQPHKGHAGPNRKPDGPPIPNYYPAILTEQEWYAARAAQSNRRTKAGRIGKRINLFAGLLRDARDGGTLQVLDKGAKSAGPALVNYKATMGVRGTKYVTFPLGTFEDAVLSKLLREIDPREVLPERDGAADRVSALVGEVDEVRRRIERLKAALGADDDIKAVVEKLREWEEREAELTAELSLARQEAATPLDGAWGEYKSLAEALAKAGNSVETRTRLRAALRRIVSTIWCLFVARGQDRLAVVQIRFEGGAHRDYIILHEAGHGNASAKRPARWSARSLKLPGLPGELDLRRPADVAALEKALAGLDLGALADGGKPAKGKKGRGGGRTKK